MTIHHSRRFATLLICLCLAVAALLPLAASAQETRKTVRVGWYESPFNITDRHGRRSGYAYEYQRKIAAYTGWEYEYVDGTWPELMQMLVNGEIDLMSDVSYTQERAEQMLFSALPMGAEEYYLFIDKENMEIGPDDFSSLNGKTVGAYQGSVQIGFFEDWERVHGIEAEILELTCSEEEALEKLHDGEMDVYLALDSFGDPETTTPICWIGSSDFYFAIKRDRQDLLDELNVAMNKIRDEDKYYNDLMVEKYMRTTSANLSLTPKERGWLDEHGPIVVGYQDDYMA
ncbi:MAG: amino acid ABC transporter substrate-binding protein, partial [Clostridia bacterium]|nr:amino acid ABC transporter substrate-binding protein [Clostridia bacterium]